MYTIAFQASSDVRRNYGSGVSLAWLFILPFVACLNHLAEAAPPAPSTTEIDKTVIVHCLVDRGTVRKVGGAIGVRVIPGKVLRISKFDCDARGGQTAQPESVGSMTAEQSATHLAGEGKTQDR
jgi:hypothetical protein